MENSEILETSVIKTAPGRNPSQIVLHRVKAKTFATHMKVFPPGAEPYLILGRYFFNLEQAKEDFIARSRELDGIQAQAEDV